MKLGKIFFYFIAKALFVLELFIFLNFRSLNSMTSSNHIVQKLWNSPFTDYFPYMTNHPLFYLFSKPPAFDNIVLAILSHRINTKKHMKIVKKIASIPLSMTFLSFCLLFFIKFSFFHQIIVLQKLCKMFFISSKKLFSCSRYSSFCNFFPFFPHFPDSKG